MSADHIVGKDGAFVVFIVSMSYMAVAAAIWATKQEGGAK